jgi:tRNA (cmo5U34)-methyltransferase
MKIPQDWTFKNLEVANSFESHVREQLPWYELATGAVAHIARHFISHGGIVYDIGASTGNIGRALDKTLEARKAKLIGIEESEEMASFYNAPGELVIANALDYEYESYDVAIVFLVLMFIDPNKRKQFVQKLIDKIKPGGCLIIVEKTFNYTGYLSTVLHRMTIAGKVSSGVSSSSIIEKELSLGGIQRPIPDSFFKMTSPTAVEFFRFGEFGGWVIEKPE